jgi:hypothetical protein
MTLSVFRLYWAEWKDKMMNEELERIRKEAVFVYSRYYGDIFLEELRKTTKILSQNLRCPR